MVKGKSRKAIPEDAFREIAAQVALGQYVCDEIESGKAYEKMMELLEAESLDAFTIWEPFERWEDAGIQEAIEELFDATLATLKSAAQPMPRVA